MRALLFLFFCCISGAVLADTGGSLRLVDSKGHYSVDGDLSIQRTAKGAITFEEIHAPDMAGRFKPSPLGQRNLGYPEDTIWLRLTLDNRSSQSTWWLEVSPLRLQHITLYQQGGEGHRWRIWEQGQAVPFYKRLLPHRSNLFPLELAPGEVQTFYIQIETVTSASLKVNLWTPGAYLGQSSVNSALQGVLFGVLFGIGLYYLLMTLVLRESLYLNFSLFLFASLLYFAAYHGFLSQYFVSLGGDLPARLIIVGVSWAAVFYLAYSIQFLQISTYSQHWYQLLLGLMSAAIAIAVFSFFMDIRTASKLISSLAPLATMVALGAAVSALLKGYRPARFYVLTLALFSMALAVRTLGVFGYVPRVFSEIGVMAALLGVIPMFAVSFADRYNLLQRNHAKVQQQMLDAERQHTLELEQQVADRTRELEEARDQAESASEAKSRFLAMMSHEMRTPMTAVLGAVELMEPERLGAENRKLLNTMDNAGKQLLALIDDVLDSAQVEKGTLRLRAEVFEVEALIGEAVQLTAGMAADKGLQLSVCHGEPGHFVVGDPLRLRQVLVNLITNAVRYTDRGDVRVKLQATPDDGYTHLRIEVEDTGCGISPNQLQSIFQPFEQLDSGLNRRTEGAGLGLAICRQLITAMGGEINVESELGAGSRFQITLSLESSRIDARVRSEKRAVAPAPLRVLLVDDIEQNRQIIRKLLVRDGHQVVVAASGQEALEILAAESFDLVLLDIQMPGMDGIELAGHIRQAFVDRESVPKLVALTANTSLHQQRPEAQTVLDGCIGKPLYLSDLYELLAPARSNTSAVHETLSALSSDLEQQYLMYLSQEELDTMVQLQRQTLAEAYQQLLDSWGCLNQGGIAAAAHRLAGGAAMLGQKELVDAAKALEVGAISEKSVELESLYIQCRSAYLVLTPEE